MRESGLLKDKIDVLKNPGLFDDDLEEEVYWQDIDEVIMPSTTSQYIDPVISSKGINLNEVEAETDKVTENVGSTSEQQEKDDPIADNIETWVRKLMEAKAMPPQSNVYREKISSKRAEDYAKTACGRIISWFWDAQLNLFAIRRTDGVQYLKKNSEALNSLPHIEFKKLARLGLINPDKDGMADMIAKWMYDDLRVKDDKDRKFHPQMGKKVKIPGRKNPLTNKPWVVMEYYPLVCEPAIPLKKWKLDILKRLTLWYFDSKTYEAVMIDEGCKEIIRVYDPLHLINLSKDDLLVLNRKEIWIPTGFQEPGLKYQNVVKLCVRRNLHAG